MNENDVDRDDFAGMDPFSDEIGPRGPRISTASVDAGKSIDTREQFFKSFEPGLEGTTLERKGQSTIVRKPNGSIEIVENEEDLQIKGERVIREHQLAKATLAAAQTKQKHAGFKELELADVGF